MEYKEAFAPRGKYGAWLRGKPMVTEVAGNIFMHAGINPATPPAKIDDLNDQLRDEIKRLDQFVERLIDLQAGDARLLAAGNPAGRLRRDRPGQRAASRRPRTPARSPTAGKLNVPLLMEAQEMLKIDSWLAINPEGALWYRGLATVTDDPAGGPFAALLQKYGAKRFVTGHTPQQSRSITVRFGGRAVLIDTGMLTSVYKGRASALEIDGDKLTAHLRDGKVTPAVNSQSAPRSGGLEPLHRFAQAFFEADGRLVAEQLLRLRDVRLRIAHVAGARVLVDRLDVGSEDLLQRRRAAGSAKCGCWWRR